MLNDITLQCLYTVLILMRLKVCFSECLPVKGVARLRSKSKSKSKRIQANKKTHAVNMLLILN